MPNKHAAFHPSADSSVANTQRHTTHLKLFCKRLGLHYTRLLNDRKRHFKLPPRKQSISSKQAEHPRTKSAENIFCTPNAAEAGLGARWNRRVVTNLEKLGTGEKSNRSHTSNLVPPRTMKKATADPSSLRSVGMTISRVGKCVGN
jgi:hypothetical protein